MLASAGACRAANALGLSAGLVLIESYTFFVCLRRGGSPHHSLVAWLAATEICCAAVGSMPNYGHARPAASWRNRWPGDSLHPSIHRAQPIDADRCTCPYLSGRTFAL